jgi:hypothetical protein
MKLIDNWKDCRKMFSQWASGAGIAGIAAYAMLPEKLQDAFPPTVALSIAFVLFALGFIGRMIKQESVSGEK